MATYFVVDVYAGCWNVLLQLLLIDFLLLSGQHGIDLSSEGEDFVDPTHAFCLFIQIQEN